MIKAQRVKYALMTPVFVIATVVAQLGFTAPASAAPVTWDGGGADGLFSTAANWSSDAVPTNGDTLVFSATSIDNNPVTVTNDIAGLSVNGISFTGAATGYGRFEIAGTQAISVSGSISSTATYSGYIKDMTISAPLTLTGDVTVSGASFTNAVNTGAHNLTLNALQATCGLQTGVLAGTGAVTITGDGGYANYSTPNTGTSAFNGTIRVTSGTFILAGAAPFSNAVDIGTSGTGEVSLVSANATYPIALTLGGSGKLTANQNGGGCGGSTPQEVYNVTVTGPVTLNSNYTFSGDNNLKLTGTYTSNGHTFATAGGSTGVLTTPEGVAEVPESTVAYDGDKPLQFETVGNKVTATLNGTRNGVNVGIGGLLKGTGTVNFLSNSGTVNPGNSPGAMTVLESYLESGVYQAEIQSKTAYDQLIVGQNATSTAIQLNSSAVLSVVLSGDWKIAAGDTFTVVDNRSTFAVNGTYSGLAEGTQFTVDGVTFAISYVGGDGNDIVLTAQNSVSAPNTGVLQAVKANPAIVAVLGIVSAAAVLGLALRRKSQR